MCFGVEICFLLSWAFVCLRSGRRAAPTASSVSSHVTAGTGMQMTTTPPQPSHASLASMQASTKAAQAGQTAALAAARLANRRFAGRAPLVPSASSSSGSVASQAQSTAAAAATLAASSRPLKDSDELSEASTMQLHSMMDDVSVTASCQAVRAWLFSHIIFHACRSSLTQSSLLQSTRKHRPILSRPFWLLLRGVHLGISLERRRHSRKR